MTRLALLSIASAIFAFPVASATLSGDAGVNSVVTEEVYDLSIAGIDIGVATLNFTSDDDSYAVTVDGGYRFLFWSGAAKIETHGLKAESGFSPRSYRSRLVSSTREVKTDIAFNEAGVEDASFRADPPLPPEQFSNRVPIEENDLLNALDPISAFFIPAATGAEACAGVLQVFSGIVRFDVELSSAGGAPDRPVCSSDYRPIGGHRVESNEVDRLRDEGLELALFEIEPGLWAPERVGFRTRFGTIALERRAD